MNKEYERYNKSPFVRKLNSVQKKRIIHKNYPFIFRY